MKANALEQVIQCFAEMPGIGRKTAQRMAYFVLNRDEQYAYSFAEALRDLRSGLRWCARCYNISETEFCEICCKENRRADHLCVVEDAVNVANIERSGSFEGYYHVLQGTLSPMNGVGPSDLRISELMDRLADGAVREVILATNPTVEGEATAVYIAESLRHLDIATTRIAVGVPIGGNLDYCDDVTMAKAIENRRQL